MDKGRRYRLTGQCDIRDTQSDTGEHIVSDITKAAALIAGAIVLSSLISVFGNSVDLSVSVPGQGQPFVVRTNHLTGGVRICRFSSYVDYRYTMACSDVNFFTPHSKTSVSPTKNELEKEMEPLNPPSSNPFDYINDDGTTRPGGEFPEDRIGPYPPAASQTNAGGNK